MIIHILNHHVWPDGSANCVYTEQLAESLTHLGCDVFLVGGSGSYRAAHRTSPITPVVKLKTLRLQRNNPFFLILEYISVFFQFISYIRTHVSSHDLLIITSDPFLNVFLHYFIPRSCTSIMWLTDYFPDGLLSVNKFYRYIYPLIHPVWKYTLSRWDKVIKISENLNYSGRNALVFRLWPTIQSLSKTDKKPKKWVLYTGNLGYVHDSKAVVSMAKKYFDKGYEIHFYADGPKIADLPRWIKVQPTFSHENELIQALVNHEVHLVAGTVNNDGGSFPSKLWNSLAIGRTIVPCGFSGKLATELNEALTSPYMNHLSNFTNYIKNLSEKRGL